MTLVPLSAAIDAPVPAVRPAPLDRLPGTADDDPFLRLAAAWLVGYSVNTAKPPSTDRPGRARRRPARLLRRRLGARKAPGRPASPPMVLGPSGGISALSVPRP